MKMLRSTNKLLSFCAAAITTFGLTACQEDDSEFNEKRINYAYVEIFVEGHSEACHAQGLRDIETIYLMNDQFERTQLHVKSVESKNEAVFTGSIPAQTSLVMTPLDADNPTYEMDFCNRIQTFKPEKGFGVYSLSKNTAYMMGEVTRPKHSKFESAVILEQQTTEIVLDISFDGAYRGTVHAVSLRTSDGQKVFTRKKKYPPLIDNELVMSSSITQFVEGLPNQQTLFECPFNVLPFELDNSILIATVYTVEDDHLLAYTQALDNVVLTKFEAGRSSTISISPSLNEYTEPNMDYTGSYQSSGKYLQKWIGPQQVIDLQRDYNFTPRYINNYAFAHNENIRTITLPLTAQYLDVCAFSSCPNLKTAVIPGGIKALGIGCFSNCPQLENVTLMEGILEISAGSFELTGLATITIPATVQAIRDRAFASCTKLSTVTLLGSTPPSLGDNAFDNTVTEVRVPAESVAAYQAADGWKEMNIVAITE